MSRAQLTVLAVDDELPALHQVAQILEASPLVGSVETATSAGDALVKLARGHFDAMFLDVRMPKIEGMEFARMMKRFAAPPCIVFVSAHRGPALTAFEVNALDYVLKPVRPERIEQALARVVEALAERPGDDGGEPAADDDVISVDDTRGGRTRLINRRAIYYIEAEGDYVRIICDDGRFLHRSPLTDIERRWEQHGFVRIHRGFVANLRRARELRRQVNGTAMLVFPNGDEIPVARRRVGELRRRLRM